MRGRETLYFASCADFTAKDGTLYDLDFLVSRKYGAVGTLVHAISAKSVSYEIPQRGEGFCLSVKSFGFLRPAKSSSPQKP